MSHLQSQVDEVKGVMTQNIERVLERGDRLEDLMDKTEELEAGVSEAIHSHKHTCTHTRSSYLTPLTLCNNPTHVSGSLESW